MATITVDQQRLILNSFAAIFQNNLVSKDLVTWKKFDGEFNDRNGMVVVEQVVPDYTTTFTTSAVNDLSSGVQDTTFGSEQYKLTQVVGASMGWADFVKIRDIGAARESEALRAAALRMAIDIDSYIMGYVAKAGNNWLGDGSTGISTFDHVASGYTRLKEQGVEDMDLRAVLAYADKQALGADVVSDNSGLTGSPAEGTYRSGWSGKVAGIDTIFTQQLAAQTVGTRVATGTTLTNGLTAVTYESVCISGGVGQFKSQTADFDGQSGTKTWLDGEVFTIAGVYAYDNRAKKRLSYLQQFRVIGDNTSSSGAFTSVRFYPAIIASGPYKTVDYTGSLDNLAVTHLGAASAVLQPRFIANKGAVVIHTADLIMPATGTAMRKSLTKVPLSVRMWQDSTFATGEHRVRFDVCIEANTRANGREKIVRING